jgi:hypothetical protein
MFVTALLAAQLVDVEVLHERADMLPPPGAVSSRVHAAIDRCERAATTHQDGSSSAP